jgi:hypothetical protein
MLRSETFGVRADPMGGYNFLTWEGPNGSVGSIPEISDIALPGEGAEAVFTALYERVSTGTKYYYITATSDEMTSISPEGVRSVLKGDSLTFLWSSKDGSSIGAVIVDGIHLTQDEIDKGYYTFRDINANHTIEVLSVISSKEIILTIELMGGSGYAMYSVNGLPFVMYNKPTVLPEGANVSVRAYADDGYTFKEWRMGETLLTGSERTINDVRDSIYLGMYFTDANEAGAYGILILIASLVLLAAGSLLLFFILFSRKSYDVITVASGADVGSAIARRKKAYHFTIAEGSSGTVVYRIGDGGQWKAVSPDKNGEYVIPKEDVIDNLTIEYR